MKIKFSPEISYFISFWKRRKTKEGIGIYGTDDKIGIFIETILKNKFTTSDKILFYEDTVYFYQTKYQQFFEKISKNIEDKIKYKNDYFYSYLAGMLDSTGFDEFNKKQVGAKNCFNFEDLIFLRLGIKAKVSKKSIFIKRTNEVEYTIQKFCKLFEKPTRLTSYLEDEPFSQDITEEEIQDIFKKTKYILKKKSNK